MARYDFSEDGGGEPRRLQVLRCEHEPCGRVWRRAERPGPAPRFCSDACKQANHRAVRRLSEADRRAYLQRQTERRLAWQAQAATRRVPQPRSPQGDGTEGAVSRTKQALEALARDIAAVQARGASDAVAQLLYRRFTELRAEAARHAQVSSSTLEDMDAVLALVNVQLGGLLATATDDVRP